MPVTRAQVRLGYVSGIPEDLSTNQFHFFTPSSPVDADLDEMTDRITAAYGFIGSRLASVIDRTLCEIRYYDLDQPEPRVPLRIDPLTFPAPSIATSLPNEVALVLSFRGPYTSGQPNARRRNRVYLGPWISTAGTNTAGQPSRPQVGTTDAMLSFAAALAQDITLDTVRWNVRSETDGTTFQVIQAWANNEFDTQRRRGVEATVRNAIPITQP